MAIFKEVSGCHFLIGFILYFNEKFDYFCKVFGRLDFKPFANTHMSPIVVAM